jgi:glycosyltransferase involved in cell wall biosynthesis
MPLLTAQPDRPRTAAESGSHDSTRQLRVALDTNGLYTTQAGVARYIRGLIKGLHRVAPDGGVTWRELGWPVETFGYAQPWRAMKTAYRELFWGKLIAPAQARRERADLVHSTGSLFLRVPRPLRHVLTLHDMSISRTPERFRRWQVYSWNRRLPNIARADRVLAISQFTADEGMRLLGLPASKIDVVHNGCDFHPADEPIPLERAPEGVSIPPEFFLFVGSLEPGKNLKLLKAAYEAARFDGRPLPPLVIVGARWQGVPGEGEKPVDWLYLGRQPDECLVWLYRHALALAFPSIYEGFGLPPIEAMALRCPVICSPTSSLPEVTGGAAHLCDLTPQAYVEGLSRLARETVLRDELIERGLGNAMRFSWTRCARQTIDVYRRAMEIV